MVRTLLYRFWHNYLFGILTLCILFLFFSPDSALTEVERQFTVPGKVIIAYNVGNPPLKFKNQKDQPAGILIDIWRLWSQKTGIEVEFRDALFADTLTKVKNGEADIHAGLFYTKERDTFLDYSSPILDINYYSYHHKSLSGVDQLDDLTPFRIGVPKGYTHTFVKEMLPDAAIEVYDNFPALYDAAIAGAIRVFVSPVMNLEYHLKQKKLTNPFRYNPARPVYSRTYFSAVQEGNKPLLDAINQGMAQISEAERIAIERKWFKRTKGEGEKETFIIACDSDYGPMTMLNARGEPAGLFVDIWKTWADNEGVQVQFLFDNWEGSIQAVKKGLADFHAGFESDEPWIASSQPFYELSANVFFPGEKHFQSLADLTGRKVASIDPFYAEVLQKANPALEIVAVADYTDLFGKLSSGEVDAFIDNELAVENVLLRQGRQGEFSKLGDFSYEFPISAIVHKKNSLLLKRINSGLQAISLAVYQQMESKWLRNPAAGYYHSIENRVVLTEEEQQWLRDHPVIRIGVDSNYAPYVFVDERGVFQGVAADYAKEISRMLGVRLEMVPELSWSEVLESARNKTLDVIIAVAGLQEREAYLDFTQDYIPTPLVIMSRSDDTRIKVRDDLEGKTVALVSEYASSKRVMEDFPSLDVFLVTTPLEGLQAVATGRADAYVGVLGINIYQANKYGVSNLKVAAPYDLQTYYQKIGVRKDWPQLAGILDKTLDAISEEKKFEIINKWVPVKGSKISRSLHPLLTQEEKAFIKAHPDIRLGIDPEFFPFEYLAKNGEYSGIASDYIQILNERLGVAMQVVPNLTWKEVISKSKKQEIDVLPCVGKNKERLSYLQFSNPYISFQRVVIARSDFPFIAGLAELQDFRVAVQADTSHDGFLSDNTTIIPQRFTTLQDSLTAVSRGDADAFIGNLASATFWIRKLHLTNLKVAAPVHQGGSQSLYFGIRKDWPELVSILNKGLVSITEEEENKIYQKWVSVAYEPGIAPKTVVGYVLYTGRKTTPVRT